MSGTNVTTRNVVPYGVRPNRDRTRPDSGQLDQIVRRAQREIRNPCGGTDGYAINELFTALYPVVVGYCTSRLGRRSCGTTTAVDVAQEVMLAVFAALPQYEKQRDSFLPFVYGIARHKVVDTFRAAGRDRDEPVADVPDRLADPAETPEQQCLTTEATARASALLGTLSQRYREIVVLRFLHGLPARDVGVLLGCSDTSVRVSTYRAMTKLRAAVLKNPESALLLSGDDPCVPS